jgi:hypothetical protein
MFIETQEEKRVRTPSGVRCPSGGPLNRSYCTPDGVRELNLIDAINIPLQMEWVILDHQSSKRRFRGLANQRSTMTIGTYLICTQKPTRLR